MHKVEKVIQHEGRDRAYFVAAPTIPPSREKTIIFLHGGHGNVWHALRAYHWELVIDKLGCRVIFPQALNKDPNQEGFENSFWRTGSDAPDYQDHCVDDGDFLWHVALTESLKPVGFAGMSSGGQMAQSMAIRYPGLTNAFSSVGGHCPGAFYDQYAKSCPAQFISGSNEDRDGLHDIRVAQWAQRNRAWVATPKMPFPLFGGKKSDKHGHMKARKQLFLGPGPVTESIVVTGMGHCYPGAADCFNGFSAAERQAEFLLRYL